MNHQGDNTITHSIIGAALEVHTQLGPGLLESAYHHCLCYELKQRGISFSSEHPMPLDYKDERLSCGYRMDIWVENRVVVELKSVEYLHDVHLAQVLTYLKIANCRTGLLLNFNVRSMRDGIQRVYNKYYKEAS